EPGIKLTTMPSCTRTSDKNKLEANKRKSFNKQYIAQPLPFRGSFKRWTHVSPTNATKSFSEVCLLFLVLRADIVLGIIAICVCLSNSCTVYRKLTVLIGLIRKWRMNKLRNTN